jgi:hypothetical protein
VAAGLQARVSPVCGFAHRPCARARTPTQTSNCTMRQLASSGANGLWIFELSACVLSTLSLLALWARWRGPSIERPHASRPDAPRFRRVPARGFGSGFCRAGLVQHDVHRLGGGGALVHGADRRRRIDRLSRPDALDAAHDEFAFGRGACASRNDLDRNSGVAGLDDTVLAGQKPRRHDSCVLWRPPFRLHHARSRNTMCEGLPTGTNCPVKVSVPFARSTRNTVTLSAR